MSEGGSELSNVTSEGEEQTSAKEVVPQVGALEPETDATSADENASSVEHLSEERDGAYSEVSASSEFPGEVVSDVEGETSVYSEELGEGQTDHGTSVTTEENILSDVEYVEIDIDKRQLILDEKEDVDHVSKELADFEGKLHEDTSDPPGRRRLVRGEFIDVSTAHIDKRNVTPVFLDLMCRRNKDKTKQLFLRGSQLINNLKRRLRDDDLKIICDYLEDRESIISIDLAYNVITSEGIIHYLVPLLQKNKSLKEVVLSNNELTLSALKSLADIASDLELTTLRLNGNKLGPKSGEALARLIDNSKRLVHLDISETEQNVSSLACLAAVLRKDYIPCCVNRFPFSRRPQNTEDVQVRKAVRRCTPSLLGLYIRQLMAAEKEKEGSDSISSVSSTTRNKFRCTSMADLRKYRQDKLSIGSMSSTELKNYIIEKEGTHNEIEDRKMMVTSLVDVTLPPMLCKYKKEKEENYLSCTRSPKIMFCKEKFLSTSITDLTQPAHENIIDENKETKKEVAKQEVIKDNVKADKNKKGNQFSASDLIKARPTTTSLVNVNLPRTQRVKAEFSDSSPEKTEFSSVCTNRSICSIQENRPDPVSEDEDSQRSDFDRNPILKILFLDKMLGHYHYQPLTNHFARILSDMIQKNDSLIELHLQKNSLTDGDVEVLCEGLKNNDTLKLLDLSANHIACQGLSYLADCLPSTGIEALILNHNNIADHGARCLFFVLPSTYLKMLDFAHNSISDVGMMDMLYSMRLIPKIYSLYIWGNPITHVSLKKIREYLVQGWLLTDTLDIKIYEVDGVLYHGWRWSADPFKTSYYTKPRLTDPPSEPPQSSGEPLQFEYYGPIHQRIISSYVPRPSPYPPNRSNTCTT